MKASQTMKNESAQVSTLPQYIQQPAVVDYLQIEERSIRETRRVEVIIDKTTDKMRIANCEGIALQMQTKAYQIIDDDLKSKETKTPDWIKTPVTAGLVDRLRKSLGLAQKPESKNKVSEITAPVDFKDPYKLIEMAMYVRSGEYPFDMEGGNTKGEVIQIINEQNPSFEALWDRIEAENPDLHRRDHKDSINSGTTLKEQRATLERAARASLLHDLGPFESPLAMQLLNDDISMRVANVGTWKTYVADADFVGQFTHQKGVSNIYPQKGIKFEHHTLCLTADDNYLAIPIHQDFANVQLYGLREVEFAFTKLSNGKFHVQNLNEPTPDRDTALAGMSKEAMKTASESWLAIKENKEENQAITSKSRTS